MKRKAVTVIGIGDDGCKGLSSRAIDAVAQSRWLVGGERQLGFFPEFGGERLLLKGALTPTIERIATIAEEHHVCVLASGDPLFFGVGGLLAKHIGREHIEFVPQPSSVQWAFARAGVSWDDAEVISLHGRPRSGFLTRLRRCAKVAVLTDEENSPRRLGSELLAHAQTGWKAWVCENLCGPDERVREFSIAELASCTDVGPLNVLILVRNQPDWRAPPAISFLEEDEFARRMPKKGLITKREVRLLSLAQLHLRPSSVVWDIGAGSGSVSIEAALLAPRGRVYAIEVDPEGVEICRENLRTHAVDNVHVIEGRAPEALSELETPDAVFVGGSKGSMDAIIEVAFERLEPGGRLVVNAVTLENAAETYQTMRRLGGVPEVTLVQIARAEPLARYLRYEALNPIQVFALEKPANTPAAAAQLPEASR
jgi:precorrin-6Y C5,15-methyltransferase (decarboxylating)